MGTAYSLQPQPTATAYSHSHSLQPQPCACACTVQRYGTTRVLSGCTSAPADPKSLPSPSQVPPKSFPNASKPYPLGASLRSRKPYVLPSRSLRGGIATCRNCTRTQEITTFPDLACANHPFWASCCAIEILTFARERGRKSSGMPSPLHGSRSTFNTNHRAKRMIPSTDHLAAMLRSDHG